MIFAIIGILKQPTPPRGEAFEAALNEHFAPNFPRIVNAGYLRGPEGEPIGLLGLIEAETFAQARAYLDASPFSEGGYYDHVHLGEFDVEVGRLG
jgi:hypothetical protein